MSTHGGWLDDVEVFVPGQLPLPGVLEPGPTHREDDVAEVVLRVVTLQPLERYL